MASSSHGFTQVPERIGLAGNQTCAPPSPVYLDRVGRSTRDGINVSTAERPGQLPLWMLDEIRGMPADDQVGAWLARKGYETLLRRYHVDMSSDFLNLGDERARL